MSTQHGPRVDYIGHERAPVIVIDDFVKNADALFAEGTRSTFQPVAGHLYPGLRAPAPQSYMKAIVSGLESMVAEVFEMRDAKIHGVESDFSLVATPRDKLQLLQCLPHIDGPDMNLIAVLHYLCQPEAGGTSFYRHRSTGFESVDAARRDRYFAALGAELKTNGPPPQDYVSGDTPLFQRIDSVGAVFNRVVIYRSASLHSGDIGRDVNFDGDPNTGRMTVNTFFHFR